VSHLSAYITHGIITTKEVVELSLNRYDIDDAQMRYKELLWREYFVQVHYRKGDSIFSNMEEDKTTIIKNSILPKQIQDKTFDSFWVNNVISELEQS
jgi:deoxyribodipyrimidine photolyase